MRLPAHPLAPLTLLVALAGCALESPEAATGSLVAELTLAEKLPRYAVIRDSAQARGIRTGYLLAGIANTETGLAHCWSEATWACQGPPSPDCGGGPVIAGSADGPCSIREGGLGMFQFDAGTFDDTLGRYGNHVLTVDGQIGAAIDYVVNMVKNSAYTTNAETDELARRWLNHFDVHDEVLRDQWVKTVLRYYNGCRPEWSCWAPRYTTYSDGMWAAINDPGGLAYWSEEVGTRCGDSPMTVGAIDEKYRSLGGCSSVLGAPVTEERGTPDGIGRYNEMEHGAIYWTLAIGAHELHGSIHAKWASLGWETSVLGYPVTDELVTADGVGRYNHFERGSIYWSPATGTAEVHGAIHDAWADSGWELGPLGYPTSDEYATDEGSRSDFEHGSILWDAATDSVSVQLDSDAPEMPEMPEADGGVSAGTPDAGVGADGGPSMTPRSGAAMATGGCSAAGDGPGGGALPWLVLLGALAFGSSRRRRRLGPLVSVLTLAVAVSACSDDSSDTSDSSGPADMAPADMARADMDGDGSTAMDDGGVPDATAADAGVPPFTPGEPIAPAALRTWEWVSIPSMRCANDTDGGFAVNFTDATDDLVIFFQGGGVCYDAVSCRASGLLGGVGANPIQDVIEAPVRNGVGIFDRNDPTNPFRDFSFVVLPHCTGDFHLGDNVRDYATIGTIHHRGYPNVTRALERIVPTFGDAERVVASGFSAGGVGITGNYHQIATAFESTGGPTPVLIDHSPATGHSTARNTSSSAPATTTRVLRRRATTSTTTAQALLRSTSRSLNARRTSTSTKFTQPPTSTSSRV